MTKTKRPVRRPAILPAHALKAASGGWFSFTVPTITVKTTTKTKEYDFEDAD
jgi:hypothetical protein